MSDNTYKRKLTVTGESGTYYLTIPKEIVRALGWRKGEFKTVRREGDDIIISDWKRS